MATLLPLVATAQEGNLPNPYLPHQANMWEFGLSLGNAMSFGDVQPKMGLGTGFHFRKAIDYLFSIRGEGFFGQLRQNDQLNGTSNTSIQTGSLQFVTSINNLAWSNLPRRRANVYGFLGGGLNRFKVDAVSANAPDLLPVAPRIQTHIDVGFGISFRLSDRINLGLEAKALTFFGRNADRLDGVNRGENDVMGYGSLRLNYNIGDAKKKTEPLYWVTPMHQIIQDVTELKNRPTYDPTDSDGDGVIDQLDADDATPRGIAVDTRGLPLDSDGDGLPNYLDDEPFIHKNHSHLLNEQDVRDIVEDEMEKLVEVGSDAFGVTEWFLPNAHFDVDSYAVREADMGNLASIARVLKANSRVKLVVTGFADKTASDHHNLELSYKRAKSIIEYFVTVQGLPRSRFVLHYNGEDGTLVPTTDSALVNRRVEFKVASRYDIDMENPVPMAKKDENQQRN
ncbi:MAG: OmpA family protein [Saprospiraceae bacterium]|nr:OmpA family protein [Saprospiraceae bacterium]